MAEQNPLAKYQLQKAGNRRNTEGMFTNTNGNAARDARRAARREQRPMTFAEMQADGVPRPGPSLEMFAGPSLSSFEAGTFTPPQADVPTGPGDYTPTADVIPPLGPAPSGVGPSGMSPAAPSTYSAMRNAALANLQAQFGAQREMLEEDMARRGLSASSIGTGRMGDLAGQQARAMASLEADLLAQEEARRNQQNELLLRIATLFGL